MATMTEIAWIESSSTGKADFMGSDHQKIA